MSNEISMPNIGPFFYVRGKLIFSAVPLSEGRRQADKIDNSYSHVELWRSAKKEGDYINFPRGRVVWDATNDRAIIYIDRCINKPAVLEKIKAGFGLGDNCVVESDSHYRCRRCVGDIFAD